MPTKILENKKAILILPADKAMATVVLNQADYENNVTDFFSDDKAYENPAKNQTRSCNIQLVECLHPITKRTRKEHKIQYKKSYHTAENFPRMCCISKIHESNNLLRPLVNYTKIAHSEH